MIVWNIQVIFQFSRSLNSIILKHLKFLNTIDIILTHRY